MRSSRPDIGENRDWVSIGIEAAVAFQLTRDETLWRYRPLSVELEEAVLQVDGLARKRLEINDDVNALCHTNAGANDLHWVWQKIAVVCNDEVRVLRAQVIQVREEELVEARRPRIQQAEAVSAGLHLQERLNLAIHQELVAQDAVKAEQVEEQPAIGGIVNLIGEGQRDIKLRKARKMKAGAFIAGVELVEQAIETQQALVRVLRGKVDAVIVIPQCAQSFVDVASRCVVRVESCQHIRIVLIAEVPNAVEVAGVAVAFRRGMPIVKMRGNRGNSKAAVLVCRWKPIDVACELGNAVVGLIRWARTGNVGAVAEGPDGLARKVGRLYYADRFLGKFVEPGWHDREPAGIQLRGLMGCRANFTGRGIGGSCRRRTKRRNGLRDRHDRKGLNECSCRWARRLFRRHAVLI